MPITFLKKTLQELKKEKLYQQKQQKQTSNGAKTLREQARLLQWKAMIKLEDIPLWKHLQVFTTPRFERDFFRCDCYHLSLEHETNGRCRYPDCECEKLSGIAFNLEIIIPIHHRIVPDKEFWKQVEKNIKERFGGFKRDATNPTNNASADRPKFRWGITHAN